ncbi:MAG: PEGA domain-containing protein, partial [Pseudomonadota bacterium]
EKSVPVNPFPSVVAQRGVPVAMFTPPAASTTVHASLSYRFSVEIQPNRAKAKSHVAIADYPESYWPGMNLPTGHYRIIITHPGFEDYEESVEISDRDVVMAVTLEKSRTRRGSR